MLFCPICIADHFSRLEDFVVAFQARQNSTQKGPFPEDQICHHHAGYPPANATITVTCRATMNVTFARYVYVYLKGSERILTLCELEVYEKQG